MTIDKLRCWFSVDDMIAFWPLTEETQGKNLVAGGTDMQLTGVLFSGDTGPWKSVPAYFQGTESSYAEGTKLSSGPTQCYGP